MLSGAAVLACAGPKEKRMKFLHAKARPQPKVQSRWYIDCSRYCAGVLGLRV